MAQAPSRVTGLKPGDVVEGRYRIISTLGEGGMGTVFLAEHALIKRRVAIKLLHAELATDATVIDRFMNEARAAGTLGHPNIVESTDMGFTHDHVPYIVFEFLEGSLLTDEIYRVGGLPVRRAVKIAQQMASALHAAHNADIVHRDLKSDNIFLTDKEDALDHVKVLDFGISRFLQTEDAAAGRGTVMGTPEYMAPEQITDPDNVDKRADIYALGVILYEMLTARRPFTSEADPRALMERIVTELPAPLARPEVPHALHELVMTRLLAKQPGDRFQSMVDVEAALDAFTTHGDAPRRRSRAIGSIKDDELARTSPAQARPAPVANTPYAGIRYDAITGDVRGASRRAKQPWVVYGLAAAGVCIGAAGLVIGLRGGTAPAPITAAPTGPVATAQEAPAMAENLAPSRAEPAKKITVLLGANAPDARVTFRRRVLTTPTSIQITASDIIELVEVSAPGKQTVRYWLTFDRPTQLQAKLPAGKGSIEATEEETLIALGEIAGPLPTPAVAVAPAKLAKDRGAAKGMAPAAAMVDPSGAVTTRKVGREAAAAVALSPVSAPVVTDAPDAALPAPDAALDVEASAIAAAEPSDQPAVGSAAPSPAEPVPAFMLDPAPAATAPAPADVAAAPAPPRAQPAITTAVPRPASPAIKSAPLATFDDNQIAALFAAHRPDVAKCVADIKGGGTLTLMLQVDAAGAVKRVQVQSTIKNPLATACVMKSARAWRFPARPGGGVTAVKNAFVIK